MNGVGEHLNLTPIRHLGTRILCSKHLLYEMMVILLSSLRSFAGTQSSSSIQYSISSVFHADFWKVQLTSIWVCIVCTVKFVIELLNRNM